MKVRDIDRFFEELDRRLDQPVQIILTGGAAGILQGVERATQDIDFEIRLKMKRRDSGRWVAVHKAIEETARATGITPEYDEDVDRWSPIALPAKSSRLYRRVGKLEVRLLNPGLWAIGKLSRYLSSDVSDLRKVLKAARTRSSAMARLWGTALGISPASSSQGLFRKQVEAFFDAYAREIWGSKEDPEALKRLFLASARKAKPS